VLSLEYKNMPNQRMPEIPEWISRNISMRHIMEKIYNETNPNAGPRLEA
jgi:hypothetical protein